MTDTHGPNAPWQEQPDGTWTLTVGDGAGLVTAPRDTTMAERARLAAAWSAQPAPAPAGTEATGVPDTITDPAYLREQYAETLRNRLAEVHAPGSHLEPEAVVDYIGCTEYELADAVLRVRDRHLQQLRQRLALAAELAGTVQAAKQRYTAEQGKPADGEVSALEQLGYHAMGQALDLERVERQRNQLAATLREVLGEFRVKTHPGESCLTTYNIPVARVQQWRAVLDQTQNG